jgi:hypothetical protein
MKETDISSSMGDAMGVPPFPKLNALAESISNADRISVLQDQIESVVYHFWLFALGVTKYSQKFKILTRKVPSSHLHYLYQLTRKFHDATQYMHVRASMMVVNPEYPVTQVNGTSIMHHRELHLASENCY